MKYILILLMFAPGMAKGQNKDTALLNQNVLYYGGGRILFDTSGYRRQLDTVKIVMLVCDTSSVDSEYSTGNIRFTTTNPIAYWKSGYEVFTWQPAGWVQDYIYAESHWEHLCYLDDRRKPLSKGIIVWMAR